MRWCSESLWLALPEQTGFLETGSFEALDITEIGGLSHIYNLLILERRRWPRASSMIETGTFVIQFYMSVQSSGEIILPALNP